MDNAKLNRIGLALNLLSGFLLSPLVSVLIGEEDLAQAEVRIERKLEQFRAEGLEALIKRDGRRLYWVGATLLVTALLILMPVVGVPLHWAARRVLSALVASTGLARPWALGLALLSLPIAGLVALLVMDKVLVNSRVVEVTMAFIVTGPSAGRLPAPVLDQTRCASSARASLLQLLQGVKKRCT